MNFEASAGEFVLSSKVETGKVAWRSPSNIALVKYWGKHGDQLPRNPSLSFTLSQSYSETTLLFKPREEFSTTVSLSFLFDGESKPDFEKRLQGYFDKVRQIFPFIDQLHFDIRSRNSFPHSSGIASSASAFSALALCLCSLEDALFETLQDDVVFRQKASYVARLGSGSASRSIFAHAALWGETGLVEGASDEYAIPVGDMLHSEFHQYCNTILLVSEEQKSVSSSAGHQLMEGHPFAENRYLQAGRNLMYLVESLRTGDVERFVQICEQEALQLHALMMCSQPYYILMQPNSLRIIQLIREFRLESKIPVAFTLDAGPNIHLLYRYNDRTKVESFIENNLLQYCTRSSMIQDGLGKGPIQIE